MITLPSEVGTGVLDAKSAEVAVPVDPSNETTDTALSDGVRTVLLNDTLDRPLPTDITSAIQPATSRVYTTRLLGRIEHFSGCAVVC